ncbi:hypothetical protein AA0Z99_03115 [Agrococcus sp. 1P02AA]|uniref:hypothetical protein n=1 Tax=Agrococcus sp. 1P02AA TaxID=3132259 RepID=UPI0039A5C859
MSDPHRQVGVVRADADAVRSCITGVWGDVGAVHGEWPTSHSRDGRSDRRQRRLQQRHSQQRPGPWRASLALLLGTAVIAAVTACGGGASPAATSTATPAGTPAATPSASSPATGAPAPTATTIPPPAVDEDDLGTLGPTEAAPLPTSEAALDEPVEFDSGVTVALVGVETVEVEAETPGEVSGTAVRVTVRASNDGADAHPIGSAVVTLAAGDEVGIGTTAGSPSPLEGDLAPGASATGVYVFMLDPATDRDIAVSVNYAAGEPVAVFTGTTS